MLKTKFPKLAQYYDKTWIPKNLVKLPIYNVRYAKDAIPT